MQILSTVLLTCGILLLPAGTLQSQWIHTSLDSTWATCFAETGANLFTGTALDGIFLSTDSGTSWAAVDSGLTIPYGYYVWSLTVSGTHIFAGTYDGVFLSTNNGTSWTEVDSGLPLGSPYRSVAALAVSGPNLFAGTVEEGIFLSTNNGTSWTAVNNGLPVVDQIFAFAICDTNLFAGTGGNGVFLSTNNGASWTAVNTGLPAGTKVYAFALTDTNLFVGTWGDGVFLSTNNGTSWTAVNTGLPPGLSPAPGVPPYPYYPTVAFAVSGTNLFAGTYGDGVFLSTNNGTSWTAVNTALPPGLSPYPYYPTVAFAVSGTNLIAGTCGGGVWRRPLSEMITSVKRNGSDIPREYSLQQNYPNPFNPTSTISYSLPQKSFVTLKLYDLLGREVRTLVNGEQEPGNYSRIVDANDLPSGVYFYSLQAGQFMEIKKMLLLK